MPYHAYLQQLNNPLQHPAPANDNNNTTNTNLSFSSSSSTSRPSLLQSSKKKRKRCGECVGCQRKDNCGECAPCRNDKSHQICKQRRCEKLTEKKVSNQLPHTPPASRPLCHISCTSASRAFFGHSVRTETIPRPKRFEPGLLRSLTHSFSKRDRKKRAYSMKIASYGALHSG